MFSTRRPVLDRGKSQDDSRPHGVSIHSCGEGSQGWKTGIFAYAIVQMYGSDSGIEMVVATIVFFIGFHPRNMELRNADRFKSALVAALQLASDDKSMGDDFKVPSLT